MIAAISKTTDNPIFGLRDGSASENVRLSFFLLQLPSNPLHYPINPPAGQVKGLTTAKTISFSKDKVHI